MEQLRLTLKQYLTGMDISEISIKLGISQSKIQLYLSGGGKVIEEENKIIDCAFSFFCEKYKLILEKINYEKTGKKVSVKIISTED